MNEADVGFAPILGENPRVLVLGTLPSQRSLAAQQYYGHPQNAFWWIMSELFGFSYELPYEERTAHVRSAGIAVWDVIRAAVRPGSMDADIEASSVEANDFTTLLAQQPSLRLLAFNGQAAQKLFKKHVNAAWTGESLLLPSTSPAYAAMTRNEKLIRWQALCRIL